MAKNRNLNDAAKGKKDEFYTQLTDIEAELNHDEYKEFFKGKTVLCNCDDPYESEFFKYFAMNFNALQLKKLIVACYAGSPVAQLELQFDTGESIDTSQHRNPYAYKVIITELKDWNKDGREDLEDIKNYILTHNGCWERLKGNGDFRSAECIEILKQADVVVTNPPFSLFREYVAQLMQYKKSFVILGNKNAITYKEIFPLIQQNKMWAGYTKWAGGLWFVSAVPEVFDKEVDGVKLKNTAAIWFTNIPLKKHQEELLLVQEYSPEKYPRYDNYDAIEVSRVADIPCDYFPDIEKKDLTNAAENEHNLSQCTMHNAQCTMHNAQCTMHNAQCTMQRNYGSAGHIPRQVQSESIRDCRKRIHARYSKWTGICQRKTNVLKNIHQAESVTALWGCQLPSLTNTTPRNLKLSEQLKAKGKDSQTACGLKVAELPSRSSTAKENISGSSYGGKCNGVMGVPITFLDKYNPNQFEILGCTYVYGDCGCHVEGTSWGAQINGKDIYKRLFIRRRDKK